MERKIWTGLKRHLESDDSPNLEGHRTPPPMSSKQEAHSAASRTIAPRHRPDDGVTVQSPSPR